MGFTHLFWLIGCGRPQEQIDRVGPRFLCPYIYNPSLHAISFSIVSKGKINQIKINKAMKKTVLLLTFLLSIVFSISTFAFNYEKKTKSFINLAYAPPPATSVNISGSEFTIDENVKIKFNKAPASSQFAYMYPMFYMSSDNVVLYPESSIELIGTSDDVVFSKVFFGYSTPLKTKYSTFTSNEGTIVTTEGSSPGMNWHGRTQNLRLTLDKGPYNFSDITNWRISMSSIYVE